MTADGNGPVAGNPPGSASRSAGNPAGPWYRRLRWEASLPVVLLLLFLMLTTAASPAPPLPKIAAISGIVAFAIAYLYIVNTMASWLQVAPGAGLGAQLAPLAVPLTVLVALAGATALVLGWWSVFFLPYLCAIVLFATSLRIGLSLTGGLLVTAIAAAFTLTTANEVRWAVLGCSASAFAVAGARIGDEFGERLRSTQRELSAAAEREQISRDVHDLLGHSLTVLTLKAEVAQRLVARDPVRARAELGEIVELSRTALGDVRSTVSRLRTPDLASQLRASRAAFAAAGLRADFRGRAADIPLPQREILAWALREATTNIIRHAAANRVHVELAPGRLRVTDDGTGIGDTPPGNGLRGLGERIGAAGGRLRIGVPSGSHGTPGTLLEVEL